MPSDITRLIFDKKNQYNGVRMQQGRVMLDSDWNDQHDIYQHRLATQTRDVIGRCGVPRNSDGFRIGNAGGIFSIAPGRFYINGLLCELFEEVYYYNQPFYPNPPFLSGNISSPPSSPPGSPPTGPGLQLEDGQYIVYLQAWIREITSLDDPMIQEVALGGADTTSRLQTVWQAGLLRGEDNLVCSTASEAWNSFIGRPTGKMEARTSSSATSTDPCSLQQSGGYRRLENQLYRIEIHTGGNRSAATYKWSRDNASIETRITEIDNLTIHVESTGKDDVLGFATGQWVEFVNEHTSLNKQPYALSKITEVNPAKSEIVIESIDPEISFTSGMKLRRWDHAFDETEGGNGLSLDAAWASIEGGIEVRFDSGMYKSGDYWLIPARTNTAEIEWPGGSISPHGVSYSWCKLAILDVVGNQITAIQDCRPQFPSLTDLNDLESGSCCTYHVRPEAGWERVFDQIEQGESAKICFEIGNYPLRTTKLVEGKGHLILEGSGYGTSISAGDVQVALRFRSCESVQITDLGVTTTGVVNEDRQDPISLKGSLTFEQVSEVVLERVKVQCGHGTTPTSSAVNVFSSKENPSLVRIEHSKILIGYMQHGIIIINTRNTLIANNQITTVPRPARLRFVNRLSANWFRNSVVSMMISNVSERNTEETNFTLTHGNNSISFRTDPSLKVNRVWERIINDDPPENVRTNKDLQKYVEKKAATILLDDRARERSPLGNYITALSRQDPSLSYQGIVVGGETGDSIHITGNEIDGMMQGIHLGLSHQAERNVFDEIIQAKIDKNKITNILAPVSSMGRHGIFVGNCKNLVIDDNDLYLKRLPMATSLAMDAIRLWGKFGEKLQVSNNYIGGLANSKLHYTVGIRIVPITDVPRSNKWKIVWNTFSVSTNMVLPAGVFDKYLDTNG